MSTAEDPADPTVLVANPSFDLYGADLQMLESVVALRAAGCEVMVVSPTPGPLQERLHATGARTTVLDYPVLRRADASPRGAVRLARAAAAALPAMRRLVASTGADVVYVNTVTVPWWLAAARLARRPAVCHVHEAEPTVSRVVQTVLFGGLLLADAVLVNSRITLETTCGAIPRLRPRTRLVYNGVEGPPDDPEPARLEPGATRLAVVGRLSPRKAPHVALEAVALLRAAGHEVTLELAGTPVAGQEDYRDRLVSRADEPDLRGAVVFAGYAAPVWPVLERADVFVATSTAEPFGNAVVEAQLALRPVVATAVEGHLETVQDGVTGRHFAVDDATGLARAVTELIDDPASARRLAEAALSRARADFDTRQYGAAVTGLVRRLAVDRGLVE